MYSKNKKISKKKSLEKISVVFIEYKTKNTGISVHMDNIVPKLGSLIVNISLGPEYIYYDIIPITVEGKTYQNKN